MFFTLKKLPTMGYIKLHRDILQWEWYDDTKMFKLFISLLLKANWKDNTWHGKKIKRGQVVISVAKLSAELGLTSHEIRGRLELLEKTKEIKKKGTNQYTIVTICNYDDYQSCDPDETQTNREPEPEQTATTKEVKKVKEIEIAIRENVRMREKDYLTLQEKYGIWTEKIIDKYHYWKLGKNDGKYRHDYSQINSWVVKALKNDEPEFAKFLKGPKPYQKTIKNPYE